MNITLVDQRAIDYSSGESTDDLETQPDDAEGTTSEPRDSTDDPEEVTSDPRESTDDPEEATDGSSGGKSGMWMSCDED